MTGRLGGPLESWWSLPGGHGGHGGCRDQVPVIQSCRVQSTEKALSRLWGRVRINGISSCQAEPSGWSVSPTALCSSVAAASHQNLNPS